MLPSDMDLKIKTGTVGYNNKILVSDGNFSVGKNENVNALVLEEPVISMPKVTSHKSLANAHELAKKPTHEDEKIALILFLTGGFTIWFMFR